MKNLTLFLALIAFGITAIAQSKTETETQPIQKVETIQKEESVQTKTVQEPAQKQPDNRYVTMKEGKVWQVVNGQKVELKEDLVLGESTIKPDGTVVMTDGTEVKLKEGNMVNATGKVIDVSAIMKKAEQKKAAEQKEMKNDPDSE